MSVDKREMRVDRSGMPKQFWAVYREWLDEGICDEPLAKKVVEWLSERDSSCDDLFYEHVRVGDEPSAADWKSLEKHMRALHEGQKHQGKCLRESSAPLLYTVVQPLAGLGTHLLYVNPGATDRHFFAFALNGPYRGRVFVPEGWCVDRNPEYVAYKASGFAQPTILRNLVAHIRDNAALQPRPAPSCTAKAAVAAAAVSDDEAEVAAATSREKHAREAPRAEEPPAKLVKVTVRPPRRPGWSTSYDPTMCNQSHEAWGGCNQCDLTSGHEGPHMWRQARTRTADDVGWQYKLREGTHVPSPVEEEVADVNDLERFGAEALPLAAKRQAAREAAREAARAVAAQVVGEPATTSPAVGCQGASLAILTEAAAGAAPAASPVPQSPTFSDLEAPYLDPGVGAVADGGPLAPMPSPPVSEIERLARQLAQKKDALATLKHEQQVVEGEIQQFKDAIVACMA